MSGQVLNRHTVGSAGRKRRRDRGAKRRRGKFSKVWLLFVDSKETEREEAKEDKREQISCFFWWRKRRVPRAKVKVKRKESGEGFR